MRINTVDSGHYICSIKLIKEACLDHCVATIKRFKKVEINSQDLIQLVNTLGAYRK